MTFDIMLLSSRHVMPNANGRGSFDIDNGTRQMIAEALLHELNNVCLGREIAI